MDDNTTGDLTRMTEHFGPAITHLLETSPIRHLWHLAFLVNFFIGPLYAELAKRYGVTRPEVQILYCLSQRGDLLAQDIALVTGQTKNTISRAISQLVHRRYLDREMHDDDRRAKKLLLTKSGRALMAELLPHFEYRQAAMRDVLSVEERKTFDALISKIVYAMPNWVDTDLS